MKIRMGFVSNSSSSSFVIVGSKLTHEDAHSKARDLIKKRRLYAEGSWCCEGVDFFEVTQDIWDAYNTSSVYKGFTFYDTQMKEEESIKINKKDIKGDEFEVYIINIDHHSTDGVEEFKERYNNYEG